MKSVTFDSTTKPNDPLVTKAKERGWQVAFVTVSVREAEGTDIEVTLRQEDLLSELGVWNEPKWDEARWADEGDASRLENILAVVSSNSFPKRHEHLTVGQLHQRRDAMILEAHVKAQRSVFVSGDETAFVKHGKREQLQTLLRTKILTPAEFNSELG